ncbi:Hypothetical protein R9X50_00220300 [Acrodontium crateriforme]|uniref:Uncharacterized protein n=1 Tax=Acrodontium crateriforme TaxID=150365 RepID=A0AAQ3M220_9PEZI|nr:Hypothetical protein R9X50_00220300 [Acrodontium crateriforme]
MCTAEMPSNELLDLLQVLKERDIALTRDDVAWAFESSRTEKETRAWVREYLAEPCLLSKEELTFHEKQGKNARKTIGTSSIGRPLSDVDFENAIASLEASTAAIEEQCQLLETQKQALHDLKVRQQSADASSHGHAQRVKQLAREKTQFELEGNELFESIQSRLQYSKKQIDLSYSGLPSSIDRILDKDDRLLDGLHGLLPTLEATGHDDITTTEVEHLCQLLTVYLTQEIRLRIGATYSAAIASSAVPNGVDKEEDDKGQLDTLYAELNELFSEIDDIVSMVVENQFLIPITHALTIKQNQSQAEKATWTIYVRDTLEYITIRLEVLDEHIKHLHAHRSAIIHTSSTLTTITASNPDTSPEKTKLTPATPFYPRLKPLRLSQVQGHNNFKPDASDPAIALLRNLDIGKVSSVSDVEKFQKTLDQTTRERRARLDDLELKTERAISDQVADAMGKADGDLGDVMQALHVHASYGGRVRLANVETQGLIDGLENQTQELGHAMRGLNVDDIVDQALALLHKSLM